MMRKNLRWNTPRKRNATSKLTENCRKNEKLFEDVFCLFYIFSFTLRFHNMKNSRSLYHHLLKLTYASHMMNIYVARLCVSNSKHKFCLFVIDICFPWSTKVDFHILLTTFFLMIFAALLFVAATNKYQSLFSFLLQHLVSHWLSVWCLTIFHTRCFKTESIIFGENFHISSFYRELMHVNPFTFLSPKWLNLPCGQFILHVVNVLFFFAIESYTHKFVFTYLIFPFYFF